MKNISFNLASKRKFLNTLVGLAFLFFLVINLIGVIIFLSSSFWNYPGGYAFWNLHKIEHHNNQKIHIDVASAMTGISRFWELRSDWTYSKEENLANFSKFNYLLTQNPLNHTQFEEVYKEDGFEKLNYRNFPHIFDISPKIYILKNKS